MDVKIETTTQGGELTLRGVRFFATVLWIKEAIRDRVGIPVESQRLLFMGQELHDHRDMMDYSIHHGSCLLLHVLPAAALALGNSIAPADLQPASATVTGSVAPTVTALGGGSSSSSIALFYLPASDILMDHLFDEAEREGVRALPDYNPPAEGMHAVAHAVRQPAALDQQGRVEVAVPVRHPAAATANAGDRTMVITLESHRGNTAALLEVSALDTPGEMRREVARMAPHLHPPEEYFFIHGQDIMRDELTLRWHDVRDGDTITLFPGTISSVSPSSSAFTCSIQL